MLDMEKIQELVKLYNECEDADSYLEKYAGGRIEVIIRDSKGQPFEIQLPTKLSGDVVHDMRTMCRSTMLDMASRIEYETSCKPGEIVNADYEVNHNEIPTTATA